MSDGEETEENKTMSDISDPVEKPPLESTSSDDTSTKATEENDSDTTIESSDTKKGSNGDTDADTDVDDGTSSKEDTRTQEEKDKETKEKAQAEKKRIEELKIKYKDWPLIDIKDPHENDVMYGRGGGTNHHPGNKRYRKMVEDRKVKYVNSKRLDKPLVALEIIREWRGQWPPGRFLKHNDKTGSWDDVGDKKAREKTSQALREKAPQIRKQQEEESTGGEDTGDKTTRFAEGTKGNKKGKVKKAILARDHSLGREYLASGEKVDLNGFTWQDPFKKEGSKDTSISSTGSANGPSTRPDVVLPPGRENSMGSTGSFVGPYGQNQHPSIPDYYGKVSFGEPRREYSNGSLGTFNQPYMPPPPGGPVHQRSGSWTHPHPPLPHGPHHQRSGSWNAGGGGRDHSFSMNPLQYTSINRPAPPGAFDQRAASWSRNHNLPPGVYPLPPPPPGAWGGFGYQSGSSMGTIGSIGAPPPGPYHSPPHAASPTRPPYDVMGAAKTWSDGGTPPPQGNFGSSQYEGHPPPGPGVHTSPPTRGGEPLAPGHLPRPGMVKRDTSNQNESYETKPSRIKKPALNRDQSATSNRLKQQYIPEALNRDMSALPKNMEQIRLSSPVPDMRKAAPKPAPLDLEARQSTMDAVTEALTDYDMFSRPPQPAPLNSGDRKNTMDELGYDLISDIGLKKPPKLTQSDRLTTSEYLDIVNAPLPISNVKTDDETPLPL
jgi:hypothetical protein